ncbi:MAG: hypothetical protein R3Y06_00765 [Faecalibacterium sp.]
MKREDIIKQFPDATQEQVTALLNINSADIGNSKKEAEKYKGERDTLQTKIGTLNTEMQGLKDANASADDYKAKFETLTAEMQKEKQRR